MTAPSDAGQTTRGFALTTVIGWYEKTRPTPTPTVDDLLGDAEMVAQFLEDQVAVKIRVGLVVDQRTGKPANIQPKGNTMQLKDTEKVDYTIEALDAKGYQVAGESFSASSSDESVVTVTDDGNGTFTAVAGAPGSATLTFTDGTLTATEAVDVVTGDVATISVVAGTPTAQ